MLLSKKVEIKVSNKQIVYFQSLYPDIKIGIPYLVNVDDLTNGSHVKVDVRCDICGTEKIIKFNRYIINSSNGGFYSCSEKCSVQKSKNTNKQRLGVEFPAQSSVCREKYKQTMLSKYGVEHIFKDVNVREICIEKSKSIESKEKRKLECLKLYGVDNPAKNTEILAKIRNTNLERYGFEFPAQNINIADKYRESIFTTAKLKYSDLTFVSKNGHDNSISCNDCDTVFNIDSTLLRYRYMNGHKICTICNDPSVNHRSEFEIGVFDYIKSLKDNIIGSFRIGRSEIDIYIPDLKIGFECNGVYWHSELFKDKNYHLVKKNLCNSNGIDLCYIWEDDWNQKRDIVKSIIRNKIGLTDNKIGARKCKVVTIDSKEAKVFMNSNHIQGFSASKYYIGLTLNNELVSVMSFSKKRQDMELVRFCNKINYNIVGAASKLFKYFMSTNTDTNVVISYADMSMFNGGMYESLGFEHISNTKPNYWWLIKDTRKHRFNFRKSKITTTEESKSKTEFQIMSELGYFRIWGVGLKKYKYMRS